MNMNTYYLGLGFLVVASFIIGYYAAGEAQSIQNSKKGIKNVTATTVVKSHKTYKNAVISPQRIKSHKSALKALIKH